MGLFHENNGILQAQTMYLAFMQEKTAEPAGSAVLF
jgi:hypothetical protein